MKYLIDKEKPIMKVKTYVQAVTFFTTVAMYEKLKKISDDQRISLSELIRGMIEKQMKVNDVNNEQVAMDQ